MDYSDDVRQVIAAFDFERIQKFMESVDWKWLVERDGEFLMTVPTIEEMKVSAERLFDHVVKKIPNPSNCSTGGSVSSYERSDGRPCFVLDFVAASSSHYGDLPLEVS